MSIEAKAILLNNLERQLAHLITAADMSKVLSALSDQLTNFQITQINIDDPQTDDLFDAYVSAMRIQCRSPKTIERYRYVISKLMQAARVPTKAVTIHHIRRFLTEEQARGLSGRTLEGYRQVYSAYFNWLQREGLIERNPTANLGAIRFPKKIKATYSDVDIEKLKSFCKNKRDLAILLFLRSTGCRISEMTELNRADIDLNSDECTVFGKGAKERTVYLDPVAKMALNEYLSERHDDSPALFVGKRKERLQPGGVRYMLKTLAKCSHVDHVHPHKFRRTLATNLIRRGMPIQEVAMILGHDKLDTTMQYVVLNKTDVKNSYNRYA